MDHGIDGLYLSFRLARHKACGNLSPLKGRVLLCSGTQAIAHSTGKSWLDCGI